MDYKWHMTPEGAKDQWLMTTTGQSQWPYQPYSTTATRGSSFLEPRAPLVVWAGMVFRQVWHHQRCDSLHLGGERYKTLQGLRSRFRGNWNMENVTGIWLHFAPWAILKRFKRQPRSENDSHEHESAAWCDMLHHFIPQHQRCSHEPAGKVRMYFTTLTKCGNQCIYFNYCKLFMLPVGIGVEFDEIVITVCFD